MRPAIRSLLALCVLACGGRVTLNAAAVPVSTAAQLVNAVNNAAPGDVITLAPGTYDLSQNVYCDNAGTAAQPITVRADSLGPVKIRFNTLEGFKVSAPYWTFENLDIQGTCLSHTDCEHAFHIVGQADFTRVRNCRLHDFNAMIKGNGEGNPFVFPDDVVIEGCELYNSTLRSTSNPVTPIDVVGGRRWVIRGNFIHDHGKGGGDGISYAAFLKGNSKNGLFERNLVICERDTTGGIRLGLSFGGGGSAPASICEGGTCTPEHQDGVMRNNIIVNCQDVGIYLNKAARTGLYNNTLYNTTGIDVRFTGSTADLRDNLLSGAIRNRDGGTSTKSANLEGVTPLQWTTWFLNPAGANFTLLNGSQIVNLGQALAQVQDDYCGTARGAAPDIGAVEYGGAVCNTAQPSPGGLAIFTDGFETGGVAAWGAGGG
ncbi:MAG TPA: right-handed parallel beta-helix repeat-containing protein [Thermoanaerobaculia bacterium]|jgi:parallel beta-helix repeat protein|nr:right-handed parallel beta-helix repeat-containing protein [Thermoanaerobaculia bacterium]